MKKKYLFMSSFFVIGTIFTLVFFWSYKVYDSGSEEVPVKEKANTVDTVTELRANASMKYVIVRQESLQAKRRRYRKNWRV